MKKVSNKKKYSLQYYQKYGKGNYIVGGEWRKREFSSLKNLKIFITENKIDNNFNVIKLKFIKEINGKIYTSQYKNLLDLKSDYFIVKHIDENINICYTAKNYIEFKNYLYNISRQNHKTFSLWNGYKIIL